MASFRPTMKIKSSAWNRKSSRSCSAVKLIMWLGIGSGILVLYSMRPESDVVYTLYGNTVILSGSSTSSSRSLTQREDAQTVKEEAQQVASKMGLAQRNEAHMTAREFSTVLARVARHASSNETTKAREMYEQQWGIVHLGKCGGVSVRSTLNGYLGCATRIGKVSRSAKWYHLSNPDVAKYRYWMLLVRDPIARIQSWWMYDHPDNFDYRRDSYGFPFRSKLWSELFDCYPTLDEFCAKGLAPLSDELPSDECRVLAQMIIPPKGSAYLSTMQHARFNFHRYFGRLLEAPEDEKRLYVVRSEHMLDDINGINRLLGDDENNTVEGVVHVSHWRTTEHLQNHRSISPEGMKNLCRQLCNEIQLYKEVLDRGINMQEKTTRESLDLLRKSCPLEVEATDCPMDDEFWKTKMEPVFRKIALRDTQQVGRDRVAYMIEKNNPPERIKKTVRIRETFHPHSEESFGMLHLGRCGGQTLRRLLESKRETSELFAKLEASWTAPGVAIFPQHQHWAIAVRDPIDRVMSWWAYHHPLNLPHRSDHREQLDKPAAMRAELNFLYECYPTFQGFVLGKPVPDRPACGRTAARSLLSGFEMAIPSMDGVHFAYDNYNIGLRQDADNRFLLVVRLEHMAEDVNAIERLLGNKNILVDEQELSQQSSSESWPVSSRQELDANAMHVLCKRICASVYAYEFILGEAINLNSKSFQESMADLRQKCPHYATTKCQAT